MSKTKFLILGFGGCAVQLGLIIAQPSGYGVMCIVIMAAIFIGSKFVEGV